ncbi:MAG: amino acid ABC transporter permease [Cyanobacteriota bacterium]|nr:amino acid ABC transporter permease [Cyanobacteriota bacterium]
MATPKSLAALTPWQRIRRDYLATPIDALITLALLAALVAGGWQLLGWARHQARWSVIQANGILLTLGRYPEPQRWRLWLLLALLAAAAGWSWGLLRGRHWPVNDRLALVVLSLTSAMVPAALGLPTAISLRWWCLNLLLLVLRWAAGRWGSLLPAAVQRSWPLLWPLLYLVGMTLIAGGLGLVRVPSSLWGGLLLTLVEATFAILLCFPIGLLLALGRRCPYPLLRWGSVAYIEFIRGAPLITLLFLGQNILGFLLPGGLSPDRVWRAAWVLSFFAAAYVAEALRAGLAVVPRGQIEAARALGLSPLQSLNHVVLPQALKVALPALVGQFITLLQDTTLLSLVGLMELLGTARGILSNPDYLNQSSEVYLVLGVLFWCCCTALGLGSRALEKRLNREPMGSAA